MMKLVLGAIGAVVALAAVAVGYALLAAILALPQTDGELKLTGLAAPVSVTRDERGVPWITAETAADAYMALGFVHAQDRFFQMEMTRRTGQGRLAEIIGRAGLGTDRFMRTLGLYRRTQEALAGADPETLAAFEAYAKGVNAFLAQGHLPLEFKLLFIASEPWQPADSLVWQRLMGLQLSANWRGELSQAAFNAKLGPERMGELFPNVDGQFPITMAATLPGRFAKALNDAMRAVVEPSLASNVWAVAGTRTESGRPLLANDPHLNFQAPNMWYLAGLSYPGTTLVGATVPGVPLHLLGHNGSLAWGFTTTHGDTQDLFVETLNDDDTYATPDGPRAFTAREETIAVRFGVPEKITVRETRHGPVISDILPTSDTAVVVAGQPRVIALAATLLEADDRTSDAIFRMARATTVEQFREAARGFYSPQHNVMFADSKGGIGYLMAGRVPLRKSPACNGMLPADGASGACDWTGWAPFDLQPQRINPPEGVLINANNRIVPDDYPVLIAADWPEGYRAQRIEEALAARAGLTMNDMIGLQHDHVSLMAREMLPLLLARAAPTDEFGMRLQEHLSAWDGTMGRERIGPLIFALWMEKLKARLVADELGELYDDLFGVRPALIKSILTEKPAWCDDIATPAAESCDTQVNAAWADTIAWIKNNAGDDDSAWRWGQWHVARFSHPLFGTIPGLSALGGFAAATDGDDFTVNRGSFTPSSSRIPFRHRHGAGYRAVYDLSDLAKSKFAMAGGQSAHVFSPHLDDLTPDWADGGMFVLTPPAGGSGRALKLVPRP
ncbi:MAG: penicillin acylase family protein [Rhodospirillaceae bacterium]|nr:penicillin acylase family protein [Rhodospirillaceae bacterium]